MVPFEGFFFPFLCQSKQPLSSKVVHNVFLYLRLSHFSTSPLLLQSQSVLCMFDNDDYTASFIFPTFSTFRDLVYIYITNNQNKLESIN